jgi:hypothetical protein
MVLINFTKCFMIDAFGFKFLITELFQSSLLDDSFFTEFDKAGLNENLEM